MEHFLIKPVGSVCNFSCDYCFYLDNNTYLKSHTMSEETLEHLFLWMKSSLAPHRTIVWQGGEPTLAGLSFFQKAIELEMKILKGTQVSNFLQTNGSLLDENWMTFLKKYQFLVGLSIDGCSQIHNTYRHTSSQKDTFDIVEKGIFLLQKHNIPFNAMAVITEESSKHAQEIYHFFKSKNIFHFQFIPCLEHENGIIKSYSVTPKSLTKFWIELFDLWYQDISENLVATTYIRFFEDCLLQFFNESSTSCSFKSKCNSYLVVEHNGDIYPCDFFVDSQYFLGNIKEKTIPEIEKSENYQNFISQKEKSSCENCDYWEFCFGGCLKLKINNSYYYCESMKEFLQYASPYLKILAQKLKNNCSSPF